ncbi:hypothetical protein FB451DRAFT_1298023, partial [Mycena latifolia]
DHRRQGYASFIHTDPEWCKTASDLRKKLAKITGELDASAQKDVVKRFSLVIDAANLGPSSTCSGPPASPQATTHPLPTTRNIWYQCPWADDTATLLKDFIWSAAAIQQSGDAIFLGLTAHQWYNRKYDLEGLKPVAHELGYDIFMDECFIRRAIDAGYKHEGRRYIHDRILDCHQTYVFVKREPAGHV